MAAGIFINDHGQMAARTLCKKNNTITLYTMNRVMKKVPLLPKTAKNDTLFSDLQDEDEDLSLTKKKVPFSVNS